jgi:hypothetical protein
VILSFVTRFCNIPEGKLVLNQVIGSMIKENMLHPSKYTPFLNSKIPNRKSIASLSIESLINQVILNAYRLRKAIVLYYQCDFCGQIRVVTIKPELKEFSRMEDVGDRR